MDVTFGIVEVPEKGRGIVSKCELEADSVLFVEQPVCSAQFSWGRHLGYAACFHCLRPLESSNEAIIRLTKANVTSLPEIDFQEEPVKVVKCTKTGTEYCCEECLKEADYRYMRMLSGEWENVKELDSLWRDLHFPPETATVTLMLKILAIKRLDPAEAEKLDKLESATTANNYVHKLLGDKFENALLLIAAGIQSVIPDVTEEEATQVFALCGRNQQGIGTCALSEWLAANDDEEEVDQIYDEIENVTGIDYMDNEGVGMYATQAMLNHDCNPNAQIKFNQNDHTLSVEILRDVEKGEEVCISYLDPCLMSKNKRARREYLLENYLFNCNCERCTEEDTEDEEDSDEEEEEPSANPDSFS